MLNESRENLFNLTPCYYFSFNNDALITRINAVFLAHLGYSAEEIIDTKKITDILTIGSKIFFQTHFFPLIKMHRKAEEIFLSFKSKEKKEIPVLLNVILDGDEQSFVIHCGGLKISQRNRFEEEILAAKAVAEKALLQNEDLVKTKEELEKSQFLLEKRLQLVSQLNHENIQINRVISHDLQEPLRKLCLISDKIIAKSNKELNGESLTDLLKLQATSYKLRDMVVKLQQYLTLNDGHFSPTIININDAFDEARARVISPETAAGINFTVQPISPVLADHSLLVSLFCELLGNSVRFKDPENPVLEISLSADTIDRNIFREMNNKYRYEEFLRLSYADNGIGFDPLYEDAIFKLFSKAHDIEDGLGLGLSYCKKIVELHGGFISVKSIKGKSTTFTILLPIWKN